MTERFVVYVEAVDGPRVYGFPLTAQAGEEAVTFMNAPGQPVATLRRLVPHESVDWGSDIPMTYVVATADQDRMEPVNNLDDRAPGAEPIFGYGLDRDEAEAYSKLAELMGQATDIYAVLP